MATKYFLRSAVTAAMLASGLAAQAGVVTFGATPFHDTYNRVDVSVTGVAYTGGPAGAFKVTLSGFTGSDAAFNGQAFESYCVDLSEYIPSQPAAYDLFTASSYFSRVNSALASDKVQALSRLISYVHSADVFGAATDKDMQSTALQLAIWNIVYDTDSSSSAIALNGGSFMEKQTTSSKTYSELRNTAMLGESMVYRGANALLSASAAYSGGPSYELFVLSSGKPISTTKGNQDQLIWREATVPEPASLALVGLALGAAGFSSRRRRP